MLTNPNTVGIFEKKYRANLRNIHDAGGLVYMDGANMNALVGVARPAIWALT
jgi:glycine dehydrogenase subunit 2